MRALIDSNVFVDYFLERNDFASSIKIIEAAITKQFNASLSASAITDIFYITEKQTKRGRDIIRLIVSFCQVLSVTEEDCLNALESTMLDFEDSVQVEVAKSAEVDFIITRNGKDFLNSGLHILSPDEFLELLNK